ATPPTGGSALPPVGGIVAPPTAAGGHASPAVPIGPDVEYRKPEPAPVPGSIPPASTKLAPM
ncbi:hypothetical protein, partial [Falsiroseomonas oryzae]